MAVRLVDHSNNIVAYENIEPHVPQVPGSGS